MFARLIAPLLVLFSCWLCSTPTALAQTLDSARMAQVDSARIDSLFRVVEQQPEKAEQNLRAESETLKDSARLAVEALTRRAWRRSMYLPGWGQVTNGGLWWIKVPVIYGGFVSTGLIFEFNNRHYHQVLKEVQYRAENNHAIPPDSQYEYIGADPQGTEYLISWKDYHRRMRDISVLATIGWYALNIIEAYVDSILKNRWEIGQALAVQVDPLIGTGPSRFGYSAPTFGFQVKLNIP